MRIIYSCVVDTAAIFQYQGWMWANSLIHFAKVPPKDIWVNYIRGTSDYFLEKIRSLGANIFELEPFGDGKYCNKIGQLSNPALYEADFVVLMDTDMVAAQPFAGELQFDCVNGKIVDLPNPSLEALDLVFEKAGVENFLGITQTSYTEANTYNGNFNGGLYGIPVKYLQTLADSWGKWALWLLETPYLEQEGKSLHTDQVSFCLALNEHRLPLHCLDVSCNFPLHLKFSKQIVPKVLHYHRGLSPRGLLYNNPDSTKEYRECINRVNAGLEKCFDAVMFEPLLYEQMKSILVHLAGKRIYLHMGTPKTGTSSLQHYLWENRQALRKQGFLYPENAVKNKHQTLVSILRNNGVGFLDFFKAFAGEEADTIILSTEGLYNHLSEFPPFSLLLLKVLGRVCSLQGIVYLRNRSEYLDSYYRQSTINPPVHESFGQACEVKEFLRFSLVANNLDYEKSLGLWSEIVGRKNLLVRPYNRNTIEDFTELLGIERTRLQPTETMNESLPTVAVELVRRCNSFLKAQDQQRLVAELRDLYIARKEQVGPFVTEEISRYLCEHYRESDQRLLQDWPQLAGILEQSWPMELEPEPEPAQRQLENSFSAG